MVELNGFATLGKSVPGTLTNMTFSHTEVLLGTGLGIKDPCLSMCKAFNNIYLHD